MASKNLIVRGGADFSGMKKELTKAQKSLDNFKSNVNKTFVGIGATLATLGIGKVIADATNSAMQMEAAMQQVNRLMGTSANEFIKWANESAIAFNMSKKEAIEYGSVYGNLLSTFTKDTAETMKYTQDLLKTSSVVASSTGRNMQDVMERIRSGLLGNTEAIEDLGINVNIAMIESTDAFKRFAGDKSWRQLDFQTQQTIRYFAILEQASTKYGDAVNDNTISRQQQLIAQLKNVQTSLGQAFLPIYNAILPALTAFATRLAEVMNLVAQFSQAVFGKSVKTQQKQVQSTNDHAEAVDNLGNAYKAAEKKAKGSLASFDEVNNLNKSESESGEVSSDIGGLMPRNDASIVEEGSESIASNIQKMADNFKSKIKVMSDFISQHKEIIVSALSGIAGGFAVFSVITNWSGIVAGFNVALATLSGIFTGLSSPILAVAAVVGILVGAIVDLWQKNEDFRNSVLEVWNEIKKNVTKIVKDTWQILKDVWEEHGDGILDNIKEFWNSIKDSIVNAWEFIKPFLMKALDMLERLWDEHIKGIIEQVAELVAKLIAGAIEIWNEFVKPLIAYLAQKLAPVFEDVFNTLMEVVEEFLVISLEVISGLLTAFGGLIDFIVGVFTSDWERAWEGVKNIFKGVFDSLVAIAKAPLNMIIDAINWVIKGLNKISIDIPDWVSDVTGIKGSWGFNIPKISHIPALAKGGITNGPMLAMIGDNPGGREVVSPLDDLKDIISSSVANAVIAANQFNSNTNQNNNNDVVIQIDGTTLARVLNPFANKEQKRVGSSAIRTI